MCVIDVDTETSSSTNAASRSLADIKNEIQNVLDLMGPSTPNISCAYNMSSDADNETSVMSVVDVMVRIIIFTLLIGFLLKGRQKRKSGSSSQRGRSIPTTVEISSSSERQSTYVPQPNSPTKDSLVADVGTLSTPDNFDTFEDTGHSCCDHCHFSTAPECLCMVRYVNQTSVPVVPSRTCDGGSKEFFLLLWYPDLTTLYIYVFLKASLVKRDFPIYFHVLSMNANGKPVLLITFSSTHRLILCPNLSRLLFNT
jgi:hypothetical protein